MQCDRLISLAKSWFTSVKEETMAPARMVQFLKQHVASCPICQEDPDIQDEIAKITELILPESKIPKAVRMKQEQEQEEAAHQEEENAKAEADKETVEETFVDDDEDNEEPLAPEEEEAQQP